jgi:hypothetical protein
MAMSRSIGLFGTYTVDEKGEISGNRVEGSTFLSWVGSVRTRDDLTLVVEGDRMTEQFRRPRGGLKSGSNGSGSNEALSPIGRQGRYRFACQS